MNGHRIACSHPDVLDAADPLEQNREERKRRRTTEMDMDASRLADLENASDFKNSLPPPTAESLFKGARQTSGGDCDGNPGAIRQSSSDGDAAGLQKQSRGVDEEDAEEICTIDSASSITDSLSYEGGETTDYEDRLEDASASSHDYGYEDGEADEEGEGVSDEYEADGADETHYPSIWHDPSSSNSLLWADERYALFLQQREFALATQLDSSNEDEYEEAGSEESIDMSYEGLLRLAERVGEVKRRGLSLHAIESLQRLTYDQASRKTTADPAATNDIQSSSCVVCLTEFQVNEQLVALHCLHRFHLECAQSWLLRKATCPICRIEVPDDAL